MQKFSLPRRMWAFCHQIRDLVTLVSLITSEHLCCGRAIEQNTKYMISEASSIQDEFLLINKDFPPFQKQSVYLLPLFPHRQ